MVLDVDSFPGEPTVTTETSTTSTGSNDSTTTDPGAIPPGPPGGEHLTMTCFALFQTNFLCSYFRQQ
jgi:hypothetical protein